MRWASCNIYSTQDHAAAAIAAGGTPVFAVKGESLKDYWDYTHRIFEWADGGSPNMILDDGGDATLLIHLGLRPRRATPKFLDSATNEEEEVLFAAIKQRLKAKPGWYGKTAKSIRGVTEETTTGVHRLYQMAKEGKLLLPGDQRQRQRHQVEVRQSLRLPRVAGRRHPPRHRRDDGRQGGDGRGLRRRRQGLGRLAAPSRLPRDGVARSIRSARCRRRWKATRSRPWRTPRRAPTSSSPRPAMSTSSRIDHMRAMKDRAIVCNIGHFDSRDPGRGAAQLEVEQRQAAGRRDRVPRRQADHPSVRRPAGQSRQRHGPSVFVMSASFTNQTLAQIELFTKPGQYEKQVYTLPKHLDEKVASLHLAKIGVEADQADPRAVEISRRSAGRPVQGGNLPVLKSEPPRVPRTTWRFRTGSNQPSPQSLCVVPGRSTFSAASNDRSRFILAAVFDATSEVLSAFRSRSFCF